MTYFLSDLSIYPIKSIKGIPLKSSQVSAEGLWGDRRYMIIKPNGEFITGREYPTLTLIKSEWIKRGIWKLSHPSHPNFIEINSDDLSTEHQDVLIWDDTLRAQKAKENINTWFSDVLNESVCLVHFSEQSKRFTSRRPESPVAFADGYPFLLTTRASLEELNTTCTQAIAMTQFRPNLVIQGNSAFEEDSWKRIRIGDVEFENVKPCIRCIFTTLDPETAERLPKGEPLKTLGKFRLLDNKGITFGINMIALNSGEIHVNDKVEVLEYKTPETYTDRRKK
ncbi:MOSC domain-containing protein [Marinomonas profundimaris]|uniref:Sulfurase n=1 Tax=Marinomonas profundimaris TaxID=1208321 RepID=W1RN94_9GAMM|nr:MOSC domain-containing protein [Marinomonas profundimaris]ETI57951.1 sulfurase [Marinomonas profundimaris]